MNSQPQTMDQCIDGTTDEYFNGALAKLILDIFNAFYFFSSYFILAKQVMANLF